MTADADKDLSASDLLDLDMRITAKEATQTPHGRPYTRLVAADRAMQPEEGWRRHDRRTVVVRDLTVVGEPVRLEVAHQRFNTPGGTRVYRRNPDILPRRGLTWRLYEEVVLLAVRHSYSEAGRLLGLPPGYVRDLCRPVWRMASACYRPVATDHRLAMDGVKPHGNFPCTMIGVPLAKGPVLDVLPEHNAEAILTWLRALEGGDAIAIFVIDPCDMLRSVIRIFSPQAVIIVDRRHMLAIVIEQVWAVRNALAIPQKMGGRGLRWLDNLREALSVPEPELADDQRAILLDAFDAFPDLCRAYWVKEAFSAIYDAPNRTEAERAFATWRRDIPPHLFRFFGPMVRRIDASGKDNWREEFFAYFEYAPHLNSNFIESANRTFKQFCHSKRGQLKDFDRLRIQTLHRFHALGDEDLRAAIDRVANDNSHSRGDVA